jgi:hypothetical protein
MLEREKQLINDAVLMFSSKMNWDGQLNIICVDIEKKIVELEAEGIHFKVDDYHVYFKDTRQRLDSITDLGEILLEVM